MQRSDFLKSTPVNMADTSDISINSMDLAINAKSSLQPRSTSRLLAGPSSKTTPESSTPSTPSFGVTISENAKKALFILKRAHTSVTTKSNTKPKIEELCVKDFALMKAILTDIVDLDGRRDSELKKLQATTPITSTEDALSLSALSEAINALVVQNAAALNAQATAMADVRKEIQDIKTHQTAEPLSYAHAAAPHAQTAKNTNQRMASKTHSTVHSFVYKAKDTAMSAEDTAKLFKSSVNMRQLGCGVNKCVNLSNNVVKVVCNSAEDVEAIMDVVNKTDALSAEVSKKKNPLLILKGVSKDVVEGELLATIIDQNPKVKNALNAQADGLKIRFKRNNQRVHLINYVLEATPEVRNALLDEDSRVFIGYARVRIQDFSSFLQCYKCLGFGHTTTHCKSTHDVCGHCAEHHKTSVCLKLKEKGALKCANCSKWNAKSRASDPTSHSASDRKCPQVKKMTQRATEMTNYGF